LNTLVEVSSKKEKRIELKENLLIHGISVVYGDVRLKLADNDYRIDSCTFEYMVREIRKKKLMIDEDDFEIEPMVLNSNENKTVFLELD
jgi:hypothetical protein